MPENVDAYINQDWFAPAVIESGSVNHCLGAVEELLNERVDLITQIKNALVSKSGESTDNLTLFGRELIPLEQTINSRVGVLRPENTQSWFRAPAAAAKGPFQAEQLSLSVFGKHHVNDIDSVKRSIKESWYQKKKDSLFFGNQGNLWGALVDAKYNFEKIIGLTGKYEAYSLMNLPENIDPRHLSPSLKAFLRNVRVEVLNLSKRLDNLYEILWSTSEKFWEYQEENKSKESKFDASKMRDAFKKRRQAKSQTISNISNPKDQKALKTMGFRELPTMDMLKKKYRELARTLHPDAGGDEAKFKELTESYSYLTNKISNQVEFIF
jgi:hypothetical protein